MASAFLQSIFHPDEILSLLQYEFDPAFKIPSDEGASREMKECFRLLNLTSRSFAMVIQKLDDELRPAICIFYLVLRGLDTIEDDMTIPSEKKIPLLHQFDSFIKTPGWTFTESGPNEKDAHLLVDFHYVIHEYLKLKPIFQEAIADITRKMAHGMTEFMTRKVVTTEDWNLYCHYVAGLVGIGLSQIFSASSLESPVIAQRNDLSNSMGLFLQKTNIIRDYLEDIEQGRIFWPKDIWSIYTQGELIELKKPENRKEALNCLNHLINSALNHVPDVIAYMSQIKNQTVFNFCAIPQVMAIATLAACYNNPRVFSGAVKIRKGEAVKLAIQSRKMENLIQIFEDYLLRIQDAVPRDGHQVNTETLRLIKKIRTEQLRVPPRFKTPSWLPFLVVLIALVTFYFYSYGNLIRS